MPGLQLLQLHPDEKPPKEVVVSAFEIKARNGVRRVTGGAKTLLPRAPMETLTHRLKAGPQRRGGREPEMVHLSLSLEGRSPPPRPGSQAGSFRAEREPLLPATPASGVPRSPLIPWLVEASPSLHIMIAVRCPCPCFSAQIPLIEARQQCWIRATYAVWPHPHHLICKDPVPVTVRVLG